PRHRCGARQRPIAARPRPAARPRRRRVARRPSRRAGAHRPRLRPDALARRSGPTVHRRRLRRPADLAAPGETPDRLPGRTTLSEPVLCASCGYSNPVGMRFCGQCGLELGSGCPRCGADMPESFLFCGRCGARLRGESDDRPGETRQITVLFADISGFTALAERLGPEELHENMRAAWDAIAVEIRASGGLIEKYIGDAVVAVFGAVDNEVDHPARAQRAALAIL